MLRSSPRHDGPEDPRATAAEWLIAADRGLTASEEQAFSRWLSASPEHLHAWQEANRTWGALDRVVELPKAADVRVAAAATTSPNRSVLKLAGLAAALGAAAVLALILRPEQTTPPPSVPEALVRLEPQRLLLPDGTLVTLNGESEISEQFTSGERRVQLVRGEAHFDIVKDEARPFVVVSHGVAVRAVGTAFNVRLAPSALEVLVTAGLVQVTGLPEGAAIPGGAAPPHALVPLLQAGERAIVPLTSADLPAVDVSPISAADLQRTRAWQSIRLRFRDLALPAVAEEFNRHNSTQLVVEPSARHVQVAGTFSADNLEVFVEFLEGAFGVTTERRADGTVHLR